jgi:hypothetical protein
MDNFKIDNFNTDIIFKLKKDYNILEDKISKIISNFKIDELSLLYKKKSIINFPSIFLNNIYYIIHKLLNYKFKLINIKNNCTYIIKYSDICNENINNIIKLCNNKNIYINYTINDIFVKIKKIKKIKKSINFNYRINIICNLDKCDNKISYCNKCINNNLLLLKSIILYQNVILMYKHINLHLDEKVMDIIKKNKKLVDIEYNNCILEKKIEKYESYFNELKLENNNIKNEIKLFNNKINDLLKNNSLILNKLTNIESKEKQSLISIKEKKIEICKSILNYIKPNIIKILEIYKLHTEYINELPDKSLKILIINIYLPETYINLNTEDLLETDNSLLLNYDLIATSLGHIIKLLLNLSKILQIIIPTKIHYYSNNSTISNYILHPLNNNYNIACKCLLNVIIDFNYLIYNYYINFFQKNNEKFKKNYNMLMEYESNLNLIHVLRFLKQNLLILIT